MRNRIVVATLLAVAAVAVGLFYGGAFEFAVAQAPRTSAEDEQVIRKSAEGYGTAFNKGDLEALMAHWAADADYVDDSGKTYKGREAIAALFKGVMTELKGYKLKLQSKSVRFVRPDVAIEDGTTELTSPEGAIETGRYTAVWTRTDGKWLISSARDLPNDAATATPANARALKELDWAVGDWNHEDEASTVNLTCRWTLDKSYLVLEYTAKVKDSEAMSATQFVGWDPLTGQLKSWVFDSKGGRGEGLWARKGNTWTIATAGVVLDGRTGSAVNHLKFVDENTFVWQSTERELDGQPVADTEIKFVRKTRPVAGK